MNRFRTFPMFALVAIATALAAGRPALAQTGVDRDDSRTRLQQMLAGAQATLNQLDLSLARSEDRLAFEWETVARLEVELDRGHSPEKIARQLEAVGGRVKEIEKDVKDVSGKLRSVRQVLKTIQDEAQRLRFRDIVNAAAKTMGFADEVGARVDLDMDDIHALDAEIARLWGRLR